MNQALLAVHLQEPFAARETSHTSTQFAARVDRFAITPMAFQKFCGADFLGVALDLQETGAALAGM
jgi:hypothetical protein